MYVFARCLWLQHASSASDSERVCTIHDYTQGITSKRERGNESAKVREREWQWKQREEDPSSMTGHIFIYTRQGEGRVGGLHTPAAKISAHTQRQWYQRSNEKRREHSTARYASREGMADAATKKGGGALLRGNSVCGVEAQLLVQSIL